MEGRRYNLSFSELVDRLHLVQMKENYGGDYESEIKDVLHDIDLFIGNGVMINADMVRAIIAMTQANVEIWINEDKEREAVDDGSVNWEEKYKRLLRTHKLNATRSECKAFIQQSIGGRTDKKLNYHNTEWKISW